MGTCFDHAGHYKVHPQAFTRRLTQAAKDMALELHSAGASATTAASIINSESEMISVSHLTRRGISL